MRNPKVVTTATAAALALVLTSCAQSEREDNTPEETGTETGNTQDAGDEGEGDAAGDATFIFGAAGEPAHFDPLYASDGETFRVTRQIYQNLIGIEEGGTAGVPELATNWESEDGLTWVFTLQEGVKFHDGTDFNAEAVCYNMDRWANQNEVAQSSAVTYYYGNDFGFGEDSLYESCEVTGDHEATVKVTRVTGKFPMVLSQISYAIQSPTALEQYNADDVKAEGEAFVFPEYAQSHPTGTGPFKFDSYDNAGGTVTLVRNDDYWGDKAGVSELVFKIIPDESARRQELEAGTIHGYDLPNPVDWAALEEAGNQVMVRPPFNILYLAFNPSADEQLADPKIRQALAHAVNREQLVATQLPEGASVATQYIPDTVEGFNDSVTEYAYDPELAKQLLAEAGASDLTIDLWYPTEVTRPYMPDPTRIYDAVKADWEAVGVTINPISKPWAGGYLEGTQGGQAPAFFLGWTGDLNSADNFLCAFFCGDSNMFGTAAYDWQDELQDALRAADAEPDPATRDGLYQDLNAKLMSNEWMPGLPISHSPPAIVVGPTVQGLVASPMTQEDFSSVTLSE